jgi:hypothetical protein
MIHVCTHTYTILLDTKYAVDLNLARRVGLLLVLNVGGDLIETDLFGDSLSSSSVLGTRLVLEDSVDLLEG